MDIQAIVYLALGKLPILTTFLATLIFGEEVVIILGFLSGLGLLPLWILFLFGFFGTLLSDLLWFSVGKFIFAEHKRKTLLHKDYHHFIRYFDKFSNGNGFIALLVTRFFYFFRILALIHIGRKEMRFNRFFLYEIPIIFIWLVSFISLGWFFGNSALRYLNILGDFQLIIIGLFVFLILFMILKGFVRRFLEKTN